MTSGYNWGAYRDGSRLTNPSGVRAMSGLSPAENESATAIESGNPH